MSVPSTQGAPQETPDEASGGAGAEATEEARTPGGHAASTWRARLRAVARVDALWFGLIAIALALRGQRILTPGTLPVPNADTTTATRWYVVAICVLLIGWWGSYDNRAFLRRPAASARSVRDWMRAREIRGPVVLSGLSILLTVLAILILRGDWSSRLGGTLWVLSLILLAAAFAGERVVNAPQAVPADREEPVRWRLPVRTEVAIFAVIMLIALVMRLWRLGDLSPGMHGDEGEAGTQGLAILNGNPVSPFTRGWFNQSNVYYWTLAIFMRIFGTGLFGLRSFALFCGLITVVFVYLLAREMFGQRAAIIAGFFISFSSVSIFFSRDQFSNDTLPPLIAMMFYFLFRGLRTRRHLHFVLAGFASGFGVYYFAGGRLLPVIGALFLGYLAVTRRGFIGAYWTRALMYLIAAAMIAAPFVAYFVAYPVLGMQYPNDRFIWLHHADLAALYGSTDWRTIIWGQLTQTLAVITYNADNSALTSLVFPIARPLEAVFVVLGVAWALTRWRDTRFGLLTIWFWTSVIIGGVLTIEAPNVPRILGVLPAMAIIIAALLDHLAGQIGAAAVKAGGQAWNRSGQAIAAVVVGAVILVSGFQNKQAYIDYFLNTHQVAIVTAQADYVHKTGLGYYYYDLGAPAIYWTHGDNRFINPQALNQGVDMVNPSASLPLIDNGPTGEMNADFLVWNNQAGYLDVIKTYYPGGHEQVVPFGDNTADPTSSFIAYTVTRQQIDSHRVLRARYVSPTGRVIERWEPSLGPSSTLPLPAGIAYPARASWDGGIIAPTFGTYGLRLSGPAGTRLSIDGVNVLPRIRSNGGTVSGSVLMAQGPHHIHLSTTLDSAGTHVDARWAPDGVTMTPVERRYLWDDHIGRSWLATIRPAPGQAILFRRVDGFLGYRSSALALAGLEDSGEWTGVLNVLQPGQYNFELNSNGSSTLSIDGRAVVTNPGDGGPHTATGSIGLDPGKHSVTVSYSLLTGVGYLEAWWTPPGQPQQMFITPDLKPSGPAVWVIRTPRKARGSP